MFFENIKKEFELELLEVNELIKTSLVSNVDLIKDVSDYIISCGGKRIRPLLTILFSKLLNCKGNKHIISACVIELIHTATLLHDDVVDISEKRRGKVTINCNWGNKEAILVGDFLYTRSFQIALEIKNFEILKLISDSANIMSEGETVQLVNKRNFNMNESDYFFVVKSKTAQLFSTSTSIGSIVANSEFDVRNSVANYGMHLGIAYQLVDDALDYITNSDKFGKNVGDDIFDGIFTLPLIYAFKNISISDKNKLYSIINNYDRSCLQDVKDIVINSGGIEYTLDIAKAEINNARKFLSILPKSKYLDISFSILDFVINRDH